MNLNDKVVCVDDAPRDGGAEIPNGWVKRGEIYCISETMEIFGCLRVIICGHPVIYHGQEIGWQSFRFRLVSEIGHPPIAIEQPQEVSA